MMRGVGNDERVGDDEGGGNDERGRVVRGPSEFKGSPTVLYTIVARVI